MFVVAGSSGNTGSVVADTLLRHGQHVRLVVRDPDKVAALRERGAEVVQARLEDADAMSEVLRDARGAYLLVPSNMMSSELLEEHRAVITALTTAVGRAQPKHVVLLSAMAAHRVDLDGPVRSLHAAERALRAVSKDVTFLRAGYFMENIASALPALPAGVYPSFLRADLPLGMVATEDVGVCAAEALLRGPRGHEVIELTGPRPYTALDIASELSRQVGQTIQVQEAPEEAIVPTIVSFGMSIVAAELMRQMVAGMNAGKGYGELPDALLTRGNTTLEQFVRRLLARAALPPR